MKAYRPTRILSPPPSADGERAWGFFHVHSFEPDEPDVILDWRGEPLGPAFIVHAWPLRPGEGEEAGDELVFQVEALIGGVLYTGRTRGHGTAWRGRRRAQQPRRH